MMVVFLDRDGVINRYPGDKKYVTSWKGFKFLPSSRKAIALLSRNKVRLFIVSNQAGINKGIFSRKSLDRITENMLAGINKAGGKISGVHYCMHRKEEGCSCRKPKTGLIKVIMAEHPVNLKESYFIGDTIRDVHTAKAAGCKSILVLSGKEKYANRNNWQEKPDYVFRNLLEAARFILERSQRK